MGSEMTTALEVARKYGYSVETWDVFANEENLPAGLLERAHSVRGKLEADGEVITHVLYDLDDTDEGFLFLGNDPEAMSWELDFHGFKEFADVPLPERQRSSLSTIGM